MHRATRERLIGAVILVLTVVAVVPALLTGPRELQQPPVRGDTPLRTLEIEITPRPKAAEVAIPEPAAEPPRPTPQSGVRAAPTGLPASEEPSAAGGAVRPRTAGPAPQPTAQPAPARAAAKPATPPSAAAAPVVAAPMPGSSWAVQLGAFSAQKTAQQMVDELRGRGYPAFIIEYRADGRVLHRVRVGPEQDRARVDALAARLAKDGYKGTVAASP